MKILAGKMQRPLETLVGIRSPWEALASRFASVGHIYLHSQHHLVGSAEAASCWLSSQTNVEWDGTCTALEL